MGAQKLEAPNEQETAWIAENLARATAMAKKYGGDAETAARPTLAGLDGLWLTWSAALRESGDNPNPLIDMVGVAVGQHLVEELGLAWVLASDEFGTELAVHGAANDILIYPCNLVAKRWESGETEFIASVVSELVRNVNDVRRR